MVRISNWEIREIVILRYVGILVVESMYNCSAVLWLEELDSFNPKYGTHMPSLNTLGLVYRG